ncbi:hypothetical protein PGB90_007232 [Kerria lacca]
MEAATGLARCQIHQFIHELEFRKIYARWVPKMLTEEHLMKRMASALEFLSLYQQDPPIIQRIVTGDETRIYDMSITTKQKSMEWRYYNSPATKKFKVIPSAGKMIGAFFWGYKSIIHIEYMPKDTAITTDAYCDTLMRLQNAIKSKRPGLLKRGGILIRDNATPHSAGITQAYLKDLKWTIFNHPPHSPDLASSDYHLFGDFKKFLRGVRFHNDDEVKNAVLEFVKTLDGNYFEEGLLKLVYRYDKCLNLMGNYVEK